MRSASVGTARSPGPNSSSRSFSPGRAPTISIGISSGSWPDNRIMLRARSMIFTCSPISRTNVSPPRAMFAARITSCTASGIVMKKRSMSGWVTVTGPPRSI